MRQYSETLRMSEQPVSQIPFKEDWGCFPNKQFAKIDPEGKSRKWVNLYRFTLLATIFLTTEWHCKDSAIQRFKPKLQWEGNRSYDALLELTTLVCRFVLHSVQTWLYRSLYYMESEERTSTTQRFPKSFRYHFFLFNIFDTAKS